MATQISENNEVIIRRAEDEKNIISLHHEANSLDATHALELLISQLTDISNYHSVPKFGVTILCNALHLKNNIEERTFEDNVLILRLANVVAQQLQETYNNNVHRFSIYEGGLPFICHLIGWSKLKIFIQKVGSDDNYIVKCTMSRDYDSILHQIISHPLFFGSKTYYDVDTLLDLGKKMLRLSLSACGALTVSVKSVKNTNCVCIPIVGHLRFVHVGNGLMHLDCASTELHVDVFKYKNNLFKIDEIIDYTDKLIGSSTEYQIY